MDPEILQTRPSNNYPVYTPRPGSPIRSIGFIAVAKPNSRTPKEHANPYTPHLSQFARSQYDFGPSVMDPLALFTQLNKYQDSELPDVNFRLLEDLLVEYFERLGIESRRIMVEQVEVNADSSAGVFVNGCRTKGEYMSEFYESDAIPFMHAANDNLPLWTAAQKDEVMTVEKIGENGTRLFNFSNAPTFLWEATLCQHFNKSLYEVGRQGDEIIAPGMTLFRGGLHRMCTAMEDDAIKIEGDISRFDKEMRSRWIKFCRDVRKRLYKGDDSAGYCRDLDTMYEWLTTHSFHLLPGGQVVLIPCGNKSGGTNTTPDNEMVHIAVLFWYCINVLGHKRLDSILDDLGGKVYSDDMCISFSTHGGKKFSRKTLIGHYKSCGFTLKPELKVHKHIEGLSFLGMKITKHDSHYIGQFDKPKLNYILLHDRRKLSVQERFEKATAIQILGRFTYDRAERRAIYDYMVLLKKDGAKGVIYTDAQLFDFWTGAESSELTPPLDSVNCSYIREMANNMRGSFEHDRRSTIAVEEDVFESFNPSPPGKIRNYRAGQDKPSGIRKRKVQYLLMTVYPRDILYDDWKAHTRFKFRELLDVELPTNNGSEEADALAHNGEMHSANGNTSTPRIGKKTAVFIGPTTQYAFADIPDGTTYYGYQSFCTEYEVDAPETSISENQGTMIVKTNMGFCDDAPSQSHSAQIVGWIWYSFQTSEVQGQYDNWNGTNKNTYEHTILEPEIRKVFVDYTVRTPMQLSRLMKGGHDASMAAARNRMMHSTNGNTPPTKVVKEKKGGKKTMTTALVVQPKIRAMNVVPEDPNKVFKVKKMTSARQTPMGDNAYKHVKEELTRLGLWEEKDGTNVKASNVKRIIMNMVLPDATTDQLYISRWGDEYADTPTAVARPQTVFSMNVANGLGGVIPSITSDFVAIFRRDPFCSLIYLDNNTAGGAYSYSMMCSTENISSGIPAPAFGQYVWGTGRYQMKPLYWKNSQGPTNYAPHGQIWYPMMGLDGRYYVWLPSGGKVIVACTNPTSGASVGVEMYIDNNGITEMAATGTQTGAAAGVIQMNLYAPVCGYYAFDTWSTVAGSSWNITVTNITSANAALAVMAHRPIADFEQFSPTVQSIRIIGMSGMVSNQTNLFNVQGSCAALSVSGNRSWCELISTGNTKILDTVQAVNFSQTTPDNGCRVWLPPASARDFDAIDISTNDPQGNFVGGVARLHLAANYGLIYYSNPANATLNLRITDTKRIEYYTETSWAEVRTAETSPVEWDEACEALRGLPTVTTNPGHFLLLANAIAKGVAKYAMPVAKFVEKLAKLVVESTGGVTEK